MNPPKLPAKKVVKKSAAKQTITKALASKASPRKAKSKGSLAKSRVHHVVDAKQVTTEKLKPYTLRLYVAGQTKKSFQALTNLQKICEEYLPNRYTIEVIDLLKHPQLAKGHQILAIPTLVREIPEPLRKIIGDLSDLDRVLVGLDLKSDH